jgi:hypothetical protein
VMPRSLNRQIEDHSRGRGTPLQGGGCCGLRPVGRGGWQGLQSGSSPLFDVSLLTGRAVMARSFSQFARGPDLHHARLRRTLRRRRFVSSWANRHQFSRNTPFSGARAFPKHSACKLSDASERHSLERLSSSSLVYGTNHSERPTHDVGSITQGLGNV